MTSLSDLHWEQLLGITKPSEEIRKQREQREGTTAQEEGEND